MPINENQNYQGQEVPSPMVQQFMPTQYIPQPPEIQNLDQALIMENQISALVQNFASSLIQIIRNAQTPNSDLQISLQVNQKQNPPNFLLNAPMLQNNSMPSQEIQNQTQNNHFNQNQEISNQAHFTTQNGGPKIQSQTDNQQVKSKNNSNPKNYSNDNTPKVSLKYVPFKNDVGIVAFVLQNENNFIELTSSDQTAPSNDILKNDNSYWSSEDVENSWIRYNFQRKVSINQYLLHFGPEETIPSDWKLEGSTNGSEWVPIDSISNYTTGEKKFIFPVHQSPFFSMFKLTQTNKNVGNNNIFCLEYVDFSGMVEIMI